MNSRLYIILIIIMLICSSCNIRHNNLFTTQNTFSHEQFPPYIFVSKWGSNGSGDGEFSEPGKIVVNSKSELYVIDDKRECIMKKNVYDTVTKVNFRIQKFDSSGNFIKKIYNFKSSGNGPFRRPRDIAVDSRDYIYMILFNGYWIQKQDSDGNFISNFGKEDPDRNGFRPYSIAVDFKNDIYIGNSDGGLHCWINKYDSNGKFIITFDWPNHDDLQQILEDIIINKTGHIYVVDYSHDYSSIYKLDQTGKFIKWWGPKGDRDFFEGNIFITNDLKDNILVSNSKENRIEIFDPNGVFITKFGSKGNKDGQFNNPRGIAVDCKGNLYVVDAGNYRIQKFKPNPEFKSK